MTSMRRTDQGKKYDAKSLSENLRDLDDAQRRGVRWTSRVVEALYTEPMWLGGLRAKPRAILAGNIQSMNGPEAPVSSAGALVHFVWDGPERGARITKIQGMTAGSDTKYRFTFLIAQGVG